MSAAMLKMLGIETADLQAAVEAFQKLGGLEPLLTAIVDQQGRILAKLEAIENQINGGPNHGGG